MKNSGESPLDFQILPASEIPGGTSRQLGALLAQPAEGTLAPGESFSILLVVPSANLPAGSYESTVTVRQPSRAPLTVPVTLQVLSPLDYLKTRLTKR